MVKIKKSTIAIVLVVIILIVVIYNLRGSDYPDLNTPKPVYGNGDILIVEFSDIECPACKAANPVIKQIKEEYSDKIQFRYYHFPLRAIHPYAQKSAEATECANDQGKMFEYIDAAFDVSPSLTTKNLNIVAQQIGLDTIKFEACLDSGTKKDEVEKDYQQGLTMGVSGTPTIFINNKPAQNWGYQTLKQMIEAEMK